jgi:hypothetical protein
MSIIKNAILNKQTILILYKGLPRILEPYILGANSAGKEFVRGYQIGGTSCTQGHGWKILDISKIQVVTPIPNQYFPQPRQGYVRKDPVITTVYASV